MQWVLFNSSTACFTCKITEPMVLRFVVCIQCYNNEFDANGVIQFCQSADKPLGGGGHLVRL